MQGELDWSRKLPFERSKNTGASVMLPVPGGMEWYKNNWKATAHVAE